MLTKRYEPTECRQLCSGSGLSFICRRLSYRIPFVLNEHAFRQNQELRHERGGELHLLGLLFGHVLHEYALYGLV